MRIVMFYHSLLSDWNHGNAHFLRGIVTELLQRGHDVAVYEPRDGWSLGNLLTHAGDQAVDAFHQAYPQLHSSTYDVHAFQPHKMLNGADLVIVHEWTDRNVIHAIGDHRLEHGGYRLLFHDTHHRSVTADSALQRIDLSSYDGVLAFGSAIRDIYLARGWSQRAWTWHEAADTRVFHPDGDAPCRGDVAWIGNWGDNERAAELEAFLIEPVRALRLQATVYGVRYPAKAQDMLRDAGIEFRGYLPNFHVPQVLNSHRLTVHIPRRPYSDSLHGIPTIRVFEALACARPLICSPWQDADRLFTQGEDYLQARDGDSMTQLMAMLLDDPDAAARLGNHGRDTVLDRHTCAHRVDELLGIYRNLDEKAQTEPESHRHERRPAHAGAVNGSAHHHIDAAAPRRRRHTPLTIAFFGSSLVSSYWNGAATYYRGIVRALARLGHHVRFYEPAILDRHAHRDMADPSWAEVVIYRADTPDAALNALAEADDADVVIKASGIGAHDSLLERELPEMHGGQRRIVYWDVDAPATLQRIAEHANDPLAQVIDQYDAVLTYGGGDEVVRAFTELGARRCVPIYNALDPDTHYPVAADARYACDLLFLGNRLPDREARVEAFFLQAAAGLPHRQFLLGGSGWNHADLPVNVRTLGHVPTHLHNTVNCAARAVLNISRQSMAATGFSPATRVFEAAGAGACIITDAWDGIEQFLEPDEQILIAHDGNEVAQLVDQLTPEQAQRIGDAARARVLAEHTYGRRAHLVEDVLAEQTLSAVTTEVHR